MTQLWDILGLWPVRVVLVGGTVLLAGRVLLALSRQPARRVWIGTAAVVAALLAIPLSLIPAWVHVSVPAQTPSRSGFQPDQGQVSNLTYDSARAVETLDLQVRSRPGQVENLTYRPATEGEPLACSCGRLALRTILKSET